MADNYDIGEAFRKIENELIASMIRNLKHHRAEEEKLGYNWSMWQTEQLKALEKYKKDNQGKYPGRFKSINSQIRDLLSMARKEGSMSQEITILNTIKNGFRPKNPKKGATAEFFRLNDQKLESLIKATTDDMERAEIAVLRRAEDQYRQVIYNAQVYANTGAGTYEKAVDMATKDFLRRGIDCIEYSNGSRHTISDYADMAIRTASKRAYLQGEGQKRQEWGIPTVIVNKRGNPCPKCLPHCGKVYIDDVWSGGPKDGKSPVTGITYPLISTAIEGGLYHPRCKDSHTTYFEGISTPPSGSRYTRDELDQLAERYAAEQKQQYVRRQEEKYDRLAKYSLDPDNRKKYGMRAAEWGKVVESTAVSDIINTSEAKEEIQVHSVGKIDRNIYKCITDDIVTDDVIITDERIEHIKERHPNDYERFYSYIPQIIADPDYIIKANKPDTATVLKEIIENGEKFQLVLRLKTSRDKPGFKNSVITFLNINERTWNKYLRNKEILYKKE